MKQIIKKRKRIKKFEKVTISSNINKEILFLDNTKSKLTHKDIKI